MNPNTTMSVRLWCLIDGDSAPFKVMPQVDGDIDDLKMLVHERGFGANHTILAKDLVLWKVRIQAVKPVLSTPTNCQ